MSEERDKQRYAERERKAHLRRLDDVLEVLERMNLHDRTDLPPKLLEVLHAEGVETTSGERLGKVIERVWAKQQPLLLPDRRSKDRRSVPRDADIDLVLASLTARLQGQLQSELEREEGRGR